MADIPCWSMVPSFTSDPNDRNLVSTVARTFSGLGQGIITVATPIILPMLSTGMTTDKGYSATGFSRWAGICGILLVIFSAICVLSTKEKNVVYGEKQVFIQRFFRYCTQRPARSIYGSCYAFKRRLVSHFRHGCLLFLRRTPASLGTKALFKLSVLSGSVLGLVVIPVLSKWMNKKKIYQISLIATIIGYVLMYIFGPVLKITIALDIAYIISSTGIAAMFVGQTISYDI